MHLDVAGTDRTEFVLSTLYTITYLTYEEEKEKEEEKEEVKEGGQERSVESFVKDIKYKHLAWRLVKNMQPEEFKQLQDYLLFSDDKTKQ